MSPFHSIFMVRRSGIICGPIWGSFPVRGSFAVQFGDHFRSGDHLRPGIICGPVQRLRNTRSILRQVKEQMSTCRGCTYFRIWDLGSLLYTEVFTSPLYNGEIWDLFYIQRHLPRHCTTATFGISFIYRGIYLAIVQRRDFFSLYIYRGNHFAVAQRRDFFPLYLRFRSVIYKLLNLHREKLANVYSFCILKQSHNMCLYAHRKSPFVS